MGENTKYVTEMLEEINKDPKLIAKYKDSVPIKILFGFAFRPEGKFLLPETDPPYKPDAAPIGMSPANLLMELKKLYVFCRPDLKQLRREQLFIQLLEQVHPSEAKLILAVKDQDITRIYKNITHKLVYENGFIPNPPPEKRKTKKDGASAPADS
jgi:hypothetical protein